jgi:cell division protein FtsW (lipid II flippase)
MNSVYKINKGINKPIEFKGLKAQYIGYLGIGILLLLILFAMLYIAGVNMFICLVLIALLGIVLFTTIYRLSDTYGQHGLIKKLAARNIPKYLTVRTRKIFTHLNK